QPAVVEEPAQLAFRVRHDLLVVDAVNSMRQYSLKMLHQVRVVPVVAAEICKVVREAEAARKQLPVTREATPERMTPGVNDGGVREQKVDETDVTEITEHLVHEAGQAPRTVHLSTRQVACGQRFNLLAVECYQRFRIGRPRRWQRTRHRLESPSGDLR